jgi:tetratricopeptide (TPR) repeat protein
MKLSGGQSGSGTLGYSLRYAGLINESIQLYQITRKLNQSAAGRGLNSIQLGKSLIYLGKIDEAIDVMHKGTKIIKDENFTSPVQLIYEGVPYIYSKTPEKAYQYFDFISETDPSNTWSIIGQTYKELISGNLEKGRDLLSSLESRNIHDDES